MLLSVLLGAVPAWADRLSFVEAAPSLGIGVGGGPFVVERQQDDGTPLTTGSPLSISLTAQPGGGQIAVGLAPRTWSAASGFTLTVPSGASRSNAFYFRHSALQTVTLTASAPGVTSAATAVVVTPMLLMDDFESGTLLQSASPTGVWEQLLNPSADINVTVGAAGAHRGTSGYRLQDTGATGGSGVQTAALSHVNRLTGDVYSRFWVRFTQTNASGSVVIWQLGRSAHLYAVLPNLDLALGGNDANMQFPYQTSPFDAAPGTWHLVEVAAMGIGASSGQLRLWVDGVERLTVPIDLSGATLEQLQLGLPWSDDRRWTGTIDFDDVRVSTTAPGTFLSVTPGTARAEACSAFELQLTSAAQGAPTPAPYPIQVAIALTGTPAALYADAACTVPTSTVTVPTGASVGTAFLRPAAAGQVDVALTHLDFLISSGSFPIPVEPAPPDSGVTLPDGGASDGGASDGGTGNDGGRPDASLLPVELAVGCGCNHAPMPFALIALGGLRLAMPRKRCRTR